MALSRAAALRGMPPRPAATAMDPSRPTHVGLIFEVSSSYTRGLIRGVSTFAQAHGPWRLHLLEVLRPAGVLATCDLCGRFVLESCTEAGVIGIDNNEEFCNVSFPSMSSIEPNAVRTGFLAAEALGRLLEGGRVPMQPNPQRAKVPQPQRPPLCRRKQSWRKSAKTCP
jgi:DNA-binding LacI/PurR family transcriptional regulator